MEVSGGSPNSGYLPALRQTPTWKREASGAPRGIVIATSPPPLRPSHGSFYRARELRRRNGLEASFSEAQLVAPVGFALDQPRR